MTRPRDSQSSKVWAALAEVPSHKNPPLDMKTLQKQADRLVKSAWFARRARKTGEKYSVIFVPNAGPCATTNYASLGPSQRTMLGLLHEIAHYMLPTTVAWHGPEFTRLLLDLVAHTGLDPLDTSPDRRKADREVLKDRYGKHNVKWKAYSPEARENARARWYERDLKSLAAELQEEMTP